ncbi:MAG: LapA family protein [Rhodospirillales bacterium]|nr:LapA family protein [Rhodospirillales bacterium]
MRLLSWIIMVPVALAVISFSVNNRGSITIDVWPAPYSVEVPIFAVVLVSVLGGMVIGAIIAWFSGGRTRSRARSNARRAKTAEREAVALREQASEAEAEETPALKALPGRVDPA